MWKPKTLDSKLLGQEIKEYYEEIKNDPEAILKTAEHFSLTTTSVYRYLKALEVSLPERNRDKHGRFIKPLDKI